MRRTKAAVAVGLSLLLAGCGSATTSVAGPSGSTATPQSTPTATPSPMSPSGEISDLRARMLAVAGVLEAKDLPTHTFAADEYSPGPVQTDSRYECMYLPTPSYLINHPGTSFTKGLQMIGSTVDVFESADQALADMSAYTTSLGQYCLMRDFTEGLTSDGLNVTDVKVTADLAQVLRADKAVRVRISYKLYGPKGMMRGGMEALIAAVSGAQVVVFAATGNKALAALPPIRQLAERAVARVSAAAAAPESEANPAVKNLGASGPALGI